MIDAELELPAPIDTTECCMHDGLVLMYVGISPRRPPITGEAASRQNIRKRLWAHYAGNAEGSTLRKTLGCLLFGQLGIQLRRVGSGRRWTFADGSSCFRPGCARFPGIRLSGDLRRECVCGWWPFGMGVSTPPSH
jgi:hypothetical protein